MLKFSRQYSGTVFSLGENFHGINTSIPEQNFSYRLNPLIIYFRCLIVKTSFAETYMFSDHFLDISFMHMTVKDLTETKNGGVVFYRRLIEYGDFAFKTSERTVTAV